MITISFEQRGSTGLCEWIYTSIRKQIIEGKLKADEKLPSKRALSENLGVSVITVQNAYSQLISEGYIYSIEKKGFFVTKLQPFGNSAGQNAKKKLIPKTPSASDEEWFEDLKNNSTNYEKFPFSLWAHTMRQVLNSGNKKLLQQSEVKGIYELRLALSNYLNQFRNMNVSPEQIIIGAGTESILGMIVQLLGRENVFAVENPGYHKAASIFELNGAKTEPLLIDRFGMNPAELEKSGANIIHISPNHHFPTGIVMPVKRRQELLSWAKKNENRYILEDDYDSEFRFNGKPLPTLQSFDSAGKVIYINSFSKTLAPSFRISFMVLPEKLLPHFESKLIFYTCPVSSFEQYTLARFIDEGFYEKHLIKMKNFYRNLRNNFIGAIENSSLSKICSIHEEEAGLHFLLSFKSDFSSEEIQNRLKNKGINLALLKDFYYRQKNFPDEKTFIVNYSGIKKENIPEIVRRIEKCLNFELI